MSAATGNKVIYRQSAMRRILRALHANECVAILIDQQVPATLFLGGKWMEEHVDETIELAGYPQFELASHTWHHPHLTRESDARVREEFARTEGQRGLVIPVIITVYNDRSFTFVTKTPPAAILLKKAAGIERASGVPNRTKVGKVTKKQVREIAELKAPDLNSATVEAAERMVMGTARSMGIEIAD